MATIYQGSSPPSRIRAMFDEVRGLRADAAAIASRARSLAGAEVALARAEVRENVTAVIRGLAWAAIAAAFAVLALAWMAVAATVALDLVMPLWSASLVTLSLLVVIAVIALLTALRYFRRTSAVPPKTLAAIREDAQWAKDQLNWRPNWTGGGEPSGATSSNSSNGSTTT